MMKRKKDFLIALFFLVICTASVSADTFVIDQPNITYTSTDLDTGTRLMKFRALQSANLINVIRDDSSAAENVEIYLDDNSTGLLSMGNYSARVGNNFTISPPFEIIAGNDYYVGFHNNGSNWNDRRLASAFPDAVAVGSVVNFSHGGYRTLVGVWTKNHTFAFELNALSFSIPGSPPPPEPETNIWNLSGKNVFVTNTSRDVAIGAEVPSQRLHVNGSANITGTMYVGRLGINRPNPTHDLHIGDGTFSALDAGETQFTTSSSREYKQNIVPVHIAVLEKIAKIPVNTYDFKQEYCGVKMSCVDKLGLIAEDFHTVFGRGSDKEINGQEVQMALWLAVQELKAENDRLKDALCLIAPASAVC